ncbi:MAG: hypothetical protein OXE40_06520 [Gammaproteobacteria bacterium]|nr:hypothetical protein [Gammaproteobacteria bacterium]
MLLVTWIGGASSAALELIVIFFAMASESQSTNAAWYSQYAPGHGPSSAPSPQSIARLPHRRYIAALPYCAERTSWDNACHSSLLSIRDCHASNNAIAPVMPCLIACIISIALSALYLEREWCGSAR